MNARNLFVEFYCLPILDIIAIVAVATWYFLRLNTNLQKYWMWKFFLSLSFLGATAIITYLTISNREMLSEGNRFLVPFHSYREVWNGGNPEIYRSNFMNAVLFYPAGLLGTVILPKKWPGWVRILLVVAVFCGISVGIEYVQYSYALGRCEIDDVIHNTLGALLGAIISGASGNLPKK